MERAGFFSRFGHGKSRADWEARLEGVVERLTESSPPDVTIVVPARQAQLGTRLELVSRLMKTKGYRLRQVVPDSGTTWAASFMRRD